MELSSHLFVVVVMCCFGCGVARLSVTWTRSQAHSQQVKFPKVDVEGARTPVTAATIKLKARARLNFLAHYSRDANNSSLPDNDNHNFLLRSRSGTVEVAMGKRKRDLIEKDTDLPRDKAARPISNASTAPAQPISTTSDTTLQIITGSYERTLHGIVAHIPGTRSSASAAADGLVTFSDSFLFNAHTSSIRCLALSPPSEAQKVFLASGSTDERINIYSLTTVPPPKPALQQLDGSKPKKHSALDALSRPTTTSAANREVGTLNHHAATVTSLSFPTRTKLLSGAADNSIAVLRTRDWEVLSSLRAPIPKPIGRPSGDTATPGEVPAGVNDVAVHPSLKLMLTVGRGEKCMRLWNLVTGKKAGVLQFSKDLLAQVGEGRHSSGEGRGAIWDADGEEFVILFERGACVFGIDSIPKAVIRPQPPTKLHQMQYLQSGDQRVLVVSTEDGRLLFYDPEMIQNRSDGKDGSDRDAKIPLCTAVAQLGGREHGVSARIKDFAILRQPRAENVNGEIPSLENAYLGVTACSDGALQIWNLQLPPSPESSPLPSSAPNGQREPDEALSTNIPQIGDLIGTYDTGARITCLKAFIMDGKPDRIDESAAVNGEEHVGTSTSDEDSDDSE